jgi:Na+/melibiose symporter-like transporter
MKKIIGIIGAVLSVFSVYALLSYLSNSSRLSEYGQGYIVGNCIILAIGMILMFYGIRRKK